MSEYVITDQMRAWGTANGYNVDLHIEYFNDYLENRTGKPYKSLDAAFRTCVRADWGGLRRAQSYAKPNQVAWWASESGVLAEGVKRGIAPRPGESMEAFKGRVNQTQARAA